MKDEAPTVSPDAQLSEWLSRFSPGIIALAKRCMTEIPRVIPCTYQIVYNYTSSVVVSFGLTDRGYEALVALSVEATRVRLCFLDGDKLPDPKGLLEGAGTKVRSITVKSASDLDSKDVQALFKASIKHFGAKFPRNREMQMIIKVKKKAETKKKAKKSSRA